MSGTILPQSFCYAGYYNGRPIAFISIVREKFKKEQLGRWRVSRLVVLPDYQGVGVGRILLNFMASYYRKISPLVPFTITTTNPQLVRGKMSGWKITHIGRNLGRPYNNGTRRASGERITMSMLYIGDKKT